MAPRNVNAKYRGGGAYTRPLGPGRTSEAAPATYVGDPYLDRILGPLPGHDEAVSRGRTPDALGRTTAQKVRDQGLARAWMERLYPKR